MAISINYLTRVISVPKADLTLVKSAPIETYELDINAFKFELKDREDNVEGMPFGDTHFYSAAITAEGAVVAQVLEIINGYTVTFEDGAYIVDLVGASTNIAEVTNSNQVQVRGASSRALAQEGVSKHPVG